ncbi:MAG: hypothetical protein Q7S34_04600 [bacterium]|nr:hypothetical protein [bacterium]
MDFIKDIIGRFTLKIPPEKLVAETIKQFLTENKIPNKEVKISIHQQEIFVQGDPYLKLFIRTNEQEILSYLKQKLPKYKISRIV